ncbi:MAG: adenosylmethionine--8-amino-7-oxononanoate transaminase [Bacteroidetes bacterium]|nr:adenosylmethionine--8-amino-7-oxononanoate transaminase [Bacteroidota bacterium]
MTLLQKDKQFVWHPFTAQKNRLPPIPIVQAKESLLFDEQGKSYIDAISSWWVTLHGHANPHIAQKIFEQALKLEQVIFAGFTHQPAVALAEKLLEKLPGGFSKIFYSDNGSTSTEVALKMAIQFWWNNDSQSKRKKILAFKNAYHGDTFGAMGVSERSVFTLAFQDLFFEVIFIDTPDENNLPALFKIIDAHAENIAAFIYEPLVQGAGGMKMYQAEYFNLLLQKVKSHDIICIADEVMTGFFRTGKFFASEYMEIKPDIICMSKGLTGGTMALGATACTDRIYDAYSSDNPLHTFFHGHSFTANPIACSAALASMELLDKEDCREKIRLLTLVIDQFTRQLNMLQGKLERPVKNIRHLGTILAFEIDEGKNEYLNSISKTITEKALKTGIYLRPLGNTVYIMPPYCITEHELKLVFDFMLSLLK